MSQLAISQLFPLCVSLRSLGMYLANSRGKIISLDCDTGDENITGRAWLPDCGLRSAPSQPRDAGPGCVSSVCCYYCGHCEPRVSAASQHPVSEIWKAEVYNSISKAIDVSLVTESALYKFWPMASVRLSAAVSVQVYRCTAADPGPDLFSSPASDAALRGDQRTLGEFLVGPGWSFYNNLIFCTLLSGCSVCAIVNQQIPLSLVTKCSGNDMNDLIGLLRHCWATMMASEYLPSKNSPFTKKI